MSVRIVFLDEDHKVVPADQASLVVETEENEAGEVVAETWGRVVSSRQAREDPTPASSGLTVGGVLLLSVSSIALLLGAPGVVGVALLVLGTALALTGLLRTRGR